MVGISIFEFDTLTASSPCSTDMVGQRKVSAEIFTWLETQALRSTEAGEGTWLRLTHRHGRKAIQVKSFVGVIRCPNGFQIEVLPKLGKTNGEKEARHLLIQMLRCLGCFRHIQTSSAQLLARHMPLLEVFIGEFLRAVDHTVKRGLRSDYVAEQGNLFALRGKLHMAQHLRLNLCRRDRFYTAYDEYSLNRPENRLLHAALRRALKWTASQQNQQLARELCFVFAGIPASEDISADLAQSRPDRGMAHYDTALAWARLILQDETPLTGTGSHHAPSLLFPMEVVFEAFVAKHLSRQLCSTLSLRLQTRSLRLVRHKEQDWFQLKPDMLVQSLKANRLVLDTKWKLVDAKKANGKEKYGLDQDDFYQLQAYGQSYLDGNGDVVLIYPKTEAFSQPLAVFEFPKSPGLRLWVLPFCLHTKQMLLPTCGSLDLFFRSNT
ncbi:McrC family protein [Pseudomonas azotoformans]